MEGKELNLNKDCKGGEGFIDRSKVRILLCDNDSKSLEEVFTLLLRCSYQVTPVRSARQVIDALNAEGPDIDLILAEVDLPLSKGMKMLKYIMRDIMLRRIPVIMMSAQDEVSIVVKCLRLGAADYLVKPLRSNELLNLWTHMWRRRRMLGLAEKNIVNYDFDLVASDPSDGNTNSTTLLSDDTESQSRRCTNAEMGISTHQEDESSAAAASTSGTTAPATATATAMVTADLVVTTTPSSTVVNDASVSVATDVAMVELLMNGLVECQPDVPTISDRRRGQFSCGPKKSELKIGESSAFFTYVKSSVLQDICQGVVVVDENAGPHINGVENVEASKEQGLMDVESHINKGPFECFPQRDGFYSSSSVPDSQSMERSCTPPFQIEFSQRNFREENSNQLLMSSRNESQVKPSGLSVQPAYPYYMPGVMNQVMMPPSAHMSFHDLQGYPNSAMLSQYNHLPHHVNGMTSFPYYPVNLCLQPGQMVNTQPWPSFGNSSSTKVKSSKIDRREAALIKFRQKRKERCFDKKIRYVNRKRLAERRPRVRGQFVRKVNGINVDLNGQPASADEDDEEDQASRDFSPEDGVSGS